jgi:pSer/pThr/pTyr-binding forkhead associated (FHA) protein
MPRVTITVPETNPQPYRFQLDRRVVTIGRGSNNDIVIDCGSVSGSHAEMRRIEGGYELRDMDSTNGIKLDGERMPVIPLRSGLSVKLGDVAFDFQLSTEEREALEREKPAVESPVMREPEEALKLFWQAKQTPASVESPVMHEPEEAPRKKVVKAHPQPEEARTELGPIICFLTFVVIAFCIGMAVRYGKETDGSWIQGVKARFLDEPAAGKDAK